MTSKSRNILGYIFSGLLGLLLLASAADKISGSAHSLQMGSSFGLSPETYRLLGLLEAASVLLFLWPRTGVLGTLLLSSYLGGAIATHLQHQQGILFPAGLEAFVWMTAIIRFPELRQRLLNQRLVASSPD
ncbi:DoxX family protein [Hymenobacter sp. YC55]|uniref:DoxX family protein n=1 Tax=Hymenobacter sp. YC55 TaxID=3034019 RepID=UPI0023F8A02C|nr:DoxX family protein [Hymenobacter sp. YC55]MDF7815246.1 DoxX family protein [Hymenobacter sp. YC55]